MTMPRLIGLLNGHGGVVVTGHEGWIPAVEMAAKPGSSVLALPECDDELPQNAAWWLELFARDVVFWPTCQASTVLLGRVAEMGCRLGFKSLWWHWCAGDWNERGRLERLL